MLKQILETMYVEPELLAELSEQQKQILFFKMREEQLRRWKERDAAPDKGLPWQSAPRKVNRKSVKWKLGADADVWVWVMGEHSSDKPYDVICDEILAERARRQAHPEAASKCLVEDFAEPSVAWTPHVLSQPPDWLEAESERKNEVEELEDARRAAAVEKARNREPAQGKPRGVEQMLADSISQMKKFSCRQGKETPRRTSAGELGSQAEVPRQTLMALKEAQEPLHKMDKEDPVWQASLRKSKAADERRRSLAKQARDDYKRLSLQGIRKGKVAEASKNFASGEQRRPPPPLPPKPKSLSTGMANGRLDSERKRALQRSVSSSTQEGIIRWFREEQFPLRAGYEKLADRIAPWFHGIIPTTRAEELLSREVPGSFLVRISERIKGYILSYLSAERCAHFLIDASSESYSFLGVDQLQHATLADLVEYHKEEPITSLGKELLLYPCGQLDQEPDYLELFD
uniref:SH2 domain containing 4A n=1 Tax=Sphenodon punctatus TaxID=8508 RepID=A0A8D0GWT0_SPHPU